MNRETIPDPATGSFNNVQHRTPLEGQLRIELDVAQRKLHLNVSDDELVKRRLAWQKPAPLTRRGYVHLYINHVTGADKGADLDFLQGSSGSIVTRDSH